MCTLFEDGLRKSHLAKHLETDHIVPQETKSPKPNPRTVVPLEALVRRVYIASSTTNWGFRRRTAAQWTYGRERPT
jgi:hypothetical protein